MSKDQAVGVTFNEATRRLLDGKNFATVATLNPDGGPHSAVVWFLRNGDTVLLSTTAGRQKARNLARDARVSLRCSSSRTLQLSGDPRHRRAAGGSGQDAAQAALAQVPGCGSAGR